MRGVTWKLPSASLKQYQLLHIHQINHLSILIHDCIMASNACHTFTLHLVCQIDPCYFLRYVQKTEVVEVGCARMPSWHAKVVIWSLMGGEPTCGVQPAKDVELFPCVAD